MSKRENVIILIRPNNPPESFGNLKKLCEEYDFKRNTLSKKKFPIELNHSGLKTIREKYKDWVIYKVEDK